MVLYTYKLLLVVSNTSGAVPDCAFGTAVGTPAQVGMYKNPVTEFVASAARPTITPPFVARKLLQLIRPRVAVVPAGATLTFKLSAYRATAFAQPVGALK